MPAIKLILTDDELAGLDSIRGQVPRERWIRALLASAIDVRDSVGQPCGLVVQEAQMGQSTVGGPVRSIIGT